MKKAFKFLLVVSAVFIVGCSNSKSEETTDGGSKKGVKVALIADGGGLGTHSFNDVAYEGLLQAEEDLDIDLSVVEVPEVSDYENALRNLASQGTQIIITPGSQIVDAYMNIAPEFLDTIFVTLDAQVEGHDNIVSSSYKEQEAAFLLGALGAELTESDIIGFVGGVSDTIQSRFENGYIAGAKYVNPNIKVITSYTGSFSDVGQGKEVAKLMYNQGADYIAPTSGAGNLGVFQAASEAGENQWAFGAANGQFHQMPEKIIASQVKRVDNAAYSVVEDYINGNLTSAHVSEYDLDNGGVDLMYSDEDAVSGHVSDEIKGRLEEIKEAIISGEITVPATSEELNEFLN